MRPDGPPLGLLLATTSKAVVRAFNRTLAEAGGSIPIWLILNALKAERRRTQADLARAVGIEGPTLTRHLDSMEGTGLVRRRRDTLDRRAIEVELTPTGNTLHGHLLQAVISFNRKLRDGLDKNDEIRLRELLRQLHDNVGQTR
jgi:MarR family transcriptional regulator for hemolysin